MQGVTQNTYNAYLKKLGVATRDVKDIRRSELEAIYKTGYWDKINGDDLPSGVDLVMFDFAVNSRPARAAIVYKQVTTKVLNPIQVINGICDARLAFMKRLGTWATFGSGWTKRVTSVRAKGLAWNASYDPKTQVGMPKPEAVANATKAVANAIIVSDTKASKASTKAAGAVVAGAAATIPAVLPMASTVPLWPFLVALGIGLAVGLFFLVKALSHKKDSAVMVGVINGL